MCINIFQRKTSNESPETAFFGKILGRNRNLRYFDQYPDSHITMSGFNWEGFFKKISDQTKNKNHVADIFYPLSIVAYNYFSCPRYPSSCTVHACFGPRLVLLRALNDINEKVQNPFWKFSEDTKIRRSIITINSHQMKSNIF